MRRQPHVDAALGAIAFGIGTSQVRDVLASQCLALDPLRVRRIEIDGRLNRGVYAKDVILTIIRRLGVQGGVGFAYEYDGSTLDAMTIEERMTICNMSIEAARIGYVNPDDTTRVPARTDVRAARRRSIARWRWQMASDKRRALRRSRVVRRRRDRADGDLGIVRAVGGDPQRQSTRSPRWALAFMGFKARQARAGEAHRRRVHRIVHQRPPVGPREAARIVRGHHVAPHVTRSSSRVAVGAPRGEARGLHEIFIDAGFEWRAAGCSDVPGDEPRQARGAAGVGVLVEPQLQGTAEGPHRTGTP